MTSGRGAWTPIGKGNKQVAYKLVAGVPVDGASPTKGVAWRAVNLGVRGIQRTLNAQGAMPVLSVDGAFGQKTTDAVAAFQSTHGLTPDGVAGAKTCLALWHSVVKAAAEEVGVDPQYLYGQMIKESAGDPGACGEHHEPDRGLVQINTAIHTEVSLNEAHDPVYSLRWSAGRMKEALEKYTGKDDDLALRAALLRHNSPVGADKLFKTGAYPTPAAQAYVEAVQREAQGWKADL